MICETRFVAQTACFSLMFCSLPEAFGRIEVMESPRLYSAWQCLKKAVAGHDLQRLFCEQKGKPSGRPVGRQGSFLFCVGGRHNVVLFDLGSVECAFCQMFEVEGLSYRVKECGHPVWDSKITQRQKRLSQPIGKSKIRTKKWHGVAKP